MSLASKVAIRLTADQRQVLERLVHTGAHPAHAVRRARILLKADAYGPDAWTDERIAQALDSNRLTVSRVRQQFATEGRDATLHKKRAANRPYRKRDGKQEAQLIALACSPSPEGQARWTMQLLADRLVELEVVASIDPSTVWRTLQQTNSSRGCGSSGSSHRRRAGPSSPRWRT
jgi:Homeodomain-like domain